MNIGLHPDIPSGVPLILKANCEERMKRIRFGPDVSNLCFDEFQRKVGHALQFDDVDFSVTWQDDDGEYCHITNTDDLKEALLYFAPSTITSSAASSGSSSNGTTELPPITMRVNVQVETAVSLSDFGSSVWGGSDEEDESWYGDEGGSSPGKKSMSNASLGSSRYRLSTASGSNARSRKTHGSSRISSQASSTSSSSSWQYPQSQMAYSPNRSEMSRHGPSPLGKWRNGVRQGSVASEDPSELNSLSSLSIHPSSRSRRQERHTHHSDSDSDGSCDTHAPRIKHAGGRNTIRQEEPNGWNVHVGIQCKTCHIEPIIGVRYHCASCVKGADFCSDCERTGNAVRLSTHHEESHIMIKFGTPLNGVDVADVLGRALHVTSQRLVEQASDSSSSTSGPSTSPTKIRTKTYAVRGQMPKNVLRCSFCAGSVIGTRYICANCPIVTIDSRDGYNLCSSCELQSLRCHDPTHFFIKIRMDPTTAHIDRIALGDRWEIQELTGGGSLLPCLYSDLPVPDPFLPPNERNGQRNSTIRLGDGLQIQGADGSQISIGSPNEANGGLMMRGTSGSEISIDGSNMGGGGALGLRGWCPPWLGGQSQRDIELQRMREANARVVVPLEMLVHPSILCDNCFQLVHGAWYRCCHCTTSYDLCGTCMSRIAHDQTHAFAVFKQPVDLDLFKSCVDHQDAGDTPGASRPMLNFSLS
ncbi:uncharacterized protein FA14DRAFT_4528 [Meira miltonrushii]|uniref:ZZ-type domain-containing protein n=1 Tax=Meira miltonrushii TaxID=1280837 RepID=A0A316VG43_9BASI|nr:uncharacterized protein FA14DRAFT_4528 [Meira miltonrushii]PWN36597.1 hypothetical protein FA14DRAFT_4528 [Meira miltonrushii]